METLRDKKMIERAQKKLKLTRAQWDSLKADLKSGLGKKQIALRYGINSVYIKYLREVIK